MVWDCVHICLFVCPCSHAHALIWVRLWLWEARGAGERRGKKTKRKRETDRQRVRDSQEWRGWRIVSVFVVVLWHGVVWCVALRRDNRMPVLLAYLCCTPHSCFCCLPLPAKSHPTATWGQRSAPPGPCSSSSGRGQITNTNHLLILVIKETLITTELRFSAALNGHEQTISETIQHATQVHPIPFFNIAEKIWKPGQVLCVCVCV